MFSHPQKSRQICRVIGKCVKLRSLRSVWSPVLSRGVFPFPPFLAVSLDIKCTKSLAQPCRICPVICKCVRSGYYNELHWNMTAVSRGVFPFLLGGCLFMSNMPSVPMDCILHHMAIIIRGFFPFSLAFVVCFRCCMFMS